MIKTRLNAGFNFYLKRSLPAAADDRIENKIKKAHILRKIHCIGCAL
jgi:hypothetical protein